jgi:uncharacterized protein
VTAVLICAAAREQCVADVDAAGISPALSSPAPGVEPVRARERISSIDVLRGVALLGILLMNIVAMGLPHWAYDDPTIAGNQTPADFWAWAINAVLFEGKMRTIFSMLFGAGVILITSRVEARGGSDSAADIHLRRNLWLVLFGMIHAYLLLWPGDILYAYGLAGVPLFVFRRMRPRTLIIIAAVILALQIPKLMFQTSSLSRAVTGLADIERITATGGTLTDEQKKSQKEWRSTVENARPTPEQLQKEIDDRRKGYLHNVSAFAGVIAMLQSTFTYKYGLWDVAATMLIGMALLKLGVLSAARSYRFYVVMALCGYGYGIAAGAWVVHDWMRAGFDPGSRWLVLYDSTRLAVALGHIAAVMLICKAGVLHWLTRRLAAVGRMALTNYIMHTLICIPLFCGFGLGLFGRLQRHELYYVVIAIWAFQLIASPVWLRYFQFGPLEWVWRSLTYHHRQPMLIRPAGPVTDAALA